MIDRNSTIEDITSLIPESVTYLMNKGIRCIKCGEPIWCTLNDAAINKGFNDEEIQIFVTELNQFPINI